jgi:hypothetical protein
MTDNVRGRTSRRRTLCPSTPATETHARGLAMEVCFIGGRVDDEARTIALLDAAKHMRTCQHTGLAFADGAEGGQTHDR